MNVYLENGFVILINIFFSLTPTSNHSSMRFQGLNFSTKSKRGISHLVVSNLVLLLPSFRAFQTHNSIGEGRLSLSILDNDRDRILSPLKDNLFCVQSKTLIMFYVFSILYWNINLPPPN